MNGTGALGYNTENPNSYEWTKLVYKALTDGAMQGKISGVDGARRATISGPCPRCSHEVHFDQLLDAVVGEEGGLNTLGLSIEIPAPAYVELVASCRCTEPHDKRPEGIDAGCGTNFRVDLLDQR